jgi:hypothetical protein
LNKDSKEGEKKGRTHRSAPKQDIQYSF